MDFALAVRSIDPISPDCGPAQSRHEQRRNTDGKEASCPKNQVHAHRQPVRWKDFLISLGNIRH